MKTEESPVPRRGNWNRRTHDWNCEKPALQSAGGKKGMRSKLDANLLDALWDQIQAVNRAAGPWGALAIWRVKEAA